MLKEKQNFGKTNGLHKIIYIKHRNKIVGILYKNNYNYNEYAIIDILNSHIVETFNDDWSKIHNWIETRYPDYSCLTLEED